MIGIFDSGVGGLTVAREIRHNLSDYDLIYFGDTARTPYGNKSKDVVIKYALEDADFLIKHGAKIIVMACNTASALAFDALKSKYPNIPIFEVITPAVNSALGGNVKKVGIIGTRGTIGSGIYEKKIKEKKSDISIVNKDCPLFVPFIEEGYLKSRELKMIVKKYLSSLKSQNLDKLILGCTHYPIIKQLIQTKIGKRVELIDSAENIAKEIKSFLKANKNIDGDLSKNKKMQVYFSDLTKQTEKMAKRIIGECLIYENSNIK